MIGVNALGQVIDAAESARVGRLARARNKDCWPNALRGLAMAYGPTSGAVYVEGHAITLGAVVCEHGWLEVGGVIVDPTPSWHRKLADEAPEARPVYFAAVRYTFDDLAPILRERPPLPLVHRDGRWGATIHAYTEARLAAYAHVFNRPPEELRDWFGGRITSTGEGTNP